MAVERAFTCILQDLYNSNPSFCAIKRCSTDGGASFYIVWRGLEPERSEGIAALRRRGRMKQGRNFRSRAVLRVEALCRDPETANAARRIKSLLLRLRGFMPKPANGKRGKADQIPPSAEPRPGPRRQRKLFCLSQAKELPCRFRYNMLYSTYPILIFGGKTDDRADKKTGTNVHSG